jgi:pimeloyl-ACP methyl ester carboxylesterase
MSSSVSLPSPLVRSILQLSPTTVGIPKNVKVTQWGSPLKVAKHVFFYFGGMPCSAEEPPIHSAMTPGKDVYAERQIHLVYIDKPGFGGSSFAYRFQIRRDWPWIVSLVADQLQISEYGVIGVSNGGPYVMASLTHPEFCSRVKVGIMVVGVSDVWASGYFSLRTPFTCFEGVYNSLPVLMTGPLNALGISLGSLYLFSCGGFSSVFPSLPEESKSALKTVLSDSTKYLGLGAAMDCQQGLSPLYARRTSRHDSTSSLDQNAMEAYGNIDVPVSLWYGTKDGSVPMKSAEWLHQQIPHSTLHKVEAGHDLYFYHVGEILDEILAKADQADHINR